MAAMASPITSLTIVYSTVYAGADQRKHQSSASLAFVGGIRRWQVDSPRKGPVTRKLFPFDDVIKSFNYRFTISKNSVSFETAIPKFSWYFIWMYECLSYVLYKIFLLFANYILRLRSFIIKDFLSSSDQVYGSVK